jgi:hypothetical protein
MSKKLILVLAGFVAGFLAASFVSLPSVGAQTAFGNSGLIQESISPSLPASYGKLAAVSGSTLYFQGDDGRVYLVRPKNMNSLESDVRVIERS